MWSFKKCSIWGMLNLFSRGLLMFSKSSGRTNVKYRCCQCWKWNVMDSKINSRQTWWHMHYFCQLLSLNSLSLGKLLYVVCYTLQVKSSNDTDTISRFSLVTNTGNTVSEVLTTIGDRRSQIFYKITFYSEFWDGFDPNTDTLIF